MADGDTPKPRRKRNAPAPTTPDPIEIAMEGEATGLAPTGSAAVVLDRHAELLTIQIALAHNERLRARLKMARDLGLALLVLLLLVGAGWAVWSASQSRGLIIEGFAAPPDAAARGLSGEVLAARFLDKLQSIDAAAYSTRAEQSVERDWAGDFQVMIPQTGVSVGAAYAQLQKALGQQTRISGDLVHEGAADVSLTIRIPGQPSVTVSGPEADLDVLLQTAAERVFGATQPFRYSRYLAIAGRSSEALAVAQRLARTGSVAERPWAYAQMALVLLGSDLTAAAEAGRRATTLMPELGTGHFAYAEAAQSLGWEEIAIREWTEASKMRFGGALYSERGVALGYTSAARAAEARGDYAEAISLRDAARSDDVTGLDPLAAEGDAARWLAALYDLRGARRRASEALPEQQATIRHAQAVALDDWPSAIAAMEARISAATQAQRDAAVDSVAFPANAPNDKVIHPDANRGDYGAGVRLERFLRPLLAIALAKAGRIPEAQVLLTTSPPDCDICLRARGSVAASAGDFAEADRFYREAIRRSPSSPFASVEWAQVRLVRGDAAGALPLLEQAKARGPHWADPLKLEGDALAQLGRDREAVRRYTEAAVRAPRWGALHLALGNALIRLNRRDQAVANWRAAAGMDLSPTDRAAVAARLRGVGA